MKNTNASSMETIAKILRVDQHLFQTIVNRLEEVTGKKNIIEEIAEKNSEIVEGCLKTLGVSSNPNAREITDALFARAEKDDRLIAEGLDNPISDKKKDCDRVIQAVLKIAGRKKGFFLKKEKAAELIKKEPPKKVMAYLGYVSVEEMLAKEDLLEVFSALRFVEGSDWLNKNFFKEYARLKPGDFEEREIEIRALDEKWADAARAFVAKKWHNISHLKELGVIFIIPVSVGVPGETLRMISLLFHYLNEVPFYSDMFRKIAKSPETFGYNLPSLLRGDIPEENPKMGKYPIWLVIQRYLAKDDEYDWRLFMPRINPEALHWTRSEHNIVEAGGLIKETDARLVFWSNLDWVGDFFKDEIGKDILVSFDLVDTVMGLVRQKEKIKYLYHHEEALWNKIFTAYLGENAVEEYCKKYLLRGYFEL